MAVKVPVSVLEALEAIRKEGNVNMLDRQGVQIEASDAGEYETVIWIEDNKKEYSRGIFEGFEAEGEGQPRQ